MQAKVVRLGCRPPFGDDRRGERSGVVAELVVQTETQFLELKVGAHRLRSQICGARLAVICEQIFESRGPMPRDRHFDAGSGRPAQSPQERGYVVAGRDLGQRLLIVCPGEAAGGIEQPMPGRVADAAAHGAGSQHRLGKADRAECRRIKIEGAASREAEGIYARRQRLKRWKRCINFGAEENAVWQHIIVAALQAGHEAPGLVEGIDRLKQIVGAAEAGACRPI